MSHMAAAEFKSSLASLHASAARLHNLLRAQSNSNLKALEPPPRASPALAQYTALPPRPEAGPEPQAPTPNPDPDSNPNPNPNTVSTVARGRRAVTPAPIVITTGHIRPPNLKEFGRIFVLTRLCLACVQRDSER